MVEKIKDLSKVVLNSQDVMLMAMVKSKIKSNLDLSSMAQKDKEDMEELISTEILAVGCDVKVFTPGQMCIRKPNSPFMYDILKTDKLPTMETVEYRVAVLHMNNILFATDLDNFNE